MTATISPRPSHIRQIEDLPELATRSEVSEFLGVSVQTMARWVVEGVGPRQTKIGQASRYRKAHILDYIESAAQSQTGDAA